MSDIIHLLPDSVANQIAAGEVVQRPSSVVKELLENSIDAGAKHIELWITDAGKTCIQVIDDGKGMTETDARLSFERHATSKITNAHDLFNLSTMGFRGEALASIAAVASVQLVTRTADDETGIDITVEGARFIDQHPVACPVGANFVVRNLFYNVPARRRFLKSNATEMNNIMQEFERVAMINPAIAFKLYRDDVLTLDLRAGSFKQRIMSLFGQSFDRQLLPVFVETELVKVEGFVATPQSAKQKGAKQFFFVNGRYMRHPYFNKAILAAYERLIPTDKQVPFFLQLTVSPKQIDVNIHPTKTEIKFEDDRAIWQILLVAARDALGKFNAVPTIDFDQSANLSIPSFRADTQTTEPRPQLSNNYNPFESVGYKQPHYRPDSVNGWQHLYELPDTANTEAISDSPTPKDNSNIPFSPQFDFPTPAVNTSSAENTTATNSSTAVYIQYGNRYIITPAKSGLMIIDFVRAHQRVLYDQFIHDVQNQNCVSQALLFPQLVNVPIDHIDLMDSLLDNFNKAGFDITSVGGGSYAVNGVPAAVGTADCNAIVAAVLEDDNCHSLTPQSLYHSLALSLSRANSMREGAKLDFPEMSNIVDNLFRCQTPNYAPDGKQIINIIPHETLTKSF